MSRLKASAILFLALVTFAGMAGAASLIYLRAQAMVSHVPWSSELARAHAQLRAAHLYALVMYGVLGMVLLAVLVAALRSQERARVAFGRSERLATTAQLAAIVAHEVRNPLGIIRAGVELLGERPGIDARGKELAGEILEEVERLNRLTQDFMMLAREAPLRLAPLEVGGLLRDVVDQVGRRVAGARLELTVAESLPEVMADPDAMRRVFFNLVLNAAQIGGPGVTIKVSAEPTSGGLSVWVRDDGPGISEAVRSRLFTPWSSERDGGTGLGLSLSRSLIERHGGKLTLEASARGASFRVFLRI